MYSGAGTSATGLAGQGACHPALAAMSYPLHRTANWSEGIQQTRLYHPYLHESAWPCRCLPEHASAWLILDPGPARRNDAWHDGPIGLGLGLGLSLPTRLRLVETECRSFLQASWQCKRCKKFARLTLPWRNYGRQNQTLEIAGRAQSRPHCSRHGTTSHFIHARPPQHGSPA